MSGARDSRVDSDPDYGRSALALGWAPAPRYLLRRAAVLEQLASAQPMRVLEIGCGAGTLLADLADRGHQGDGVETSASARELARIILTDIPAMQVLDALPSARAAYDLLCAFEVLEHIEDDRGALAEWVSRVKSGGRVMLSVPAYRMKWTATDTWAGHVRRYDRADLVRLAESAGIAVTRCVHYGFPLADAIEPIAAWRRGRERKGDTRDDRTADSGVQRAVETRIYPMLRSWPGRLVMRASIRMQRWFASSRRGNGLLLTGRRL